MDQDFNDELPYEENDKQEAEQTPPEPPLAERISSTRLYLLADSTASLHGRLGKRKAADISNDEDDDDFDTRQTPSHRSNAILLQGEPVTHLSTSRIFSYAAQFEATPMGLEWVDDQTCVLVYETDGSARRCYTLLRRDADEVEDEDGFIMAKTVPVTLWPIEERLNKLLGQSDGLRGALKMRWAKEGDVKKRGAKNQSEFYKKHGENAGKEGHPQYVNTGEPNKRRRANEGEDLKARLDEQLDTFLEEREGDGGQSTTTSTTNRQSSSPRPARRREAGESRARRPPDPSRPKAPLPRRAREPRQAAPSKESLDDELDRFLKERE